MIRSRRYTTVKKTEFSLALPAENRLVTSTDFTYMSTTLYETIRLDTSLHTTAGPRVK